MDYADAVHECLNHVDDKFEMLVTELLVRPQKVWLHLINSAKFWILQQAVKVIISLHFDPQWPVEYMRYMWDLA